MVKTIQEDSQNGASARKPVRFEELGDEQEKPESAGAGAGAGAGSPTSAPDDRPPMPAQHSEQLPPEHQQAAERYCAHCAGMHHSQVKPLLHHMHAMYSAQLGLPGDKMAAHVPPPAPAVPPAGQQAPPGAPAAAVPPAGAGAPAGTPPGAAAEHQPNTKPEHQKSSPVGLSGDSSWNKPEHEKHNAPVAGPGVGPAFIPGEEKKRMSAVQAGIEQHVAADRYQSLERKVDALELDKARAEYERDLLPLSYRYQFDLTIEVERMAKHRYAKPACDEQIATIKACYRERDNPPIGGGWVMTGNAPNGLPTRGEDVPEKVTYEEKKKAVKYASQNKCSLEESLEKIRS